MARHAKRLSRWLAWSIAVLFLLALGALAVLWWWIDPDDWRREIEARASTAIGRPVKLTGALRWQLGERIIIHSDGGEIANAAGFDAEPLARWSHLQFDIAARPLLDRQVKIGSIRIDGLQLELQRNDRGDVNWNLHSPAAGKQSGSAPGRSVAMRIGVVELHDAALRYRDAASGADWHATKIAARADLPADLAAQAQEFRNLQLSGSVAGGPLAGSVPFELQAPALSWSPQQIALPQFSVRGALATAQGSVMVKPGTAPEFNAALSMQAPSLRDLLATVSIKLPAMRDDTALGRFELGASVQHSSGATRADELSVVLDDTHLTGSLSLPRLDPLALRFDLTADRMDLDRYREPGKSKPMELPLAWLKQLDARGTLRIREARVEGVVAKDLRLDVR
jgi:AsmA protein